MKFAVYTVSPPGYVHSAAFDEVALTLQEGLTELGNDAVCTRKLATPDRRHIVLGANLAPRAGVTLPADAVIYNLEQVDPASPWLTPALLALYRAHTVWDYSPVNLAALIARGVAAPQLVPIGYVPTLSRIAAQPDKEDIDVLFYGSLNPRRRQILRSLADAGVKVQTAFGVYGAARDALIARARVVLNVHYYQANVFEIVRVSYLLANSKAVVSETGIDQRQEAAFMGAVAFAAYDQLVATCLRLLAQPQERAALARAGYAFFSSRGETTYLAPAVAALTAPGRDPWAGAAPVRVLLVPDVEAADDTHEQTLVDLGQDIGRRPDVTIGVALSSEHHAAVPASILRAAEKAGAGDLMLLERPAEGDATAWRRLLAGASHFVPTGPQPALRALALSLGITPVDQSQSA